MTNISMLEDILNEVPNRVPALPYWMMTTGDFEQELRKGGLQIHSEREKALAADIFRALQSFYYSDPEEFNYCQTDDYVERFDIEFGDRVVPRSAIKIRGDFEGKPSHTGSVHLGREEAHAVIIAWPVTYPFLWKTWLELMRALESVEVIILIPARDWEDLIQYFLDSHHVGGQWCYMVVKGLNDIWVQDFVPLLTYQNGELIAVEAEYMAPGMENFWKYRELLQVAGREVARQLGAKIHLLPVRLDWGHFIYHDSRVVISATFLENPYRYRGRTHFCYRGGMRKQGLRIIREHFDLDPIVIPADPFDPTFHVDGTTRFLDGRRIFLARWWGAADLFKEQKEALEKGGLEVVELYCGTGRRSLLAPEEFDATGCYLNYLELPDRIVVPTFGLDEEEKVLRTIAEACGKQVRRLNCSRLAAGGGALHCISKAAPKSYSACGRRWSGRRNGLNLGGNGICELTLGLADGNMEELYWSIRDIWRMKDLNLNF